MFELVTLYICPAIIVPAFFVAVSEQRYQPLPTLVIVADKLVQEPILNPVIPVPILLVVPAFVSNSA